LLAIEISRKSNVQGDPIVLTLDRHVFEHIYDREDDQNTIPAHE